MRKLIWPVLFLLLLVVQGAVTVFYTGWLSFDLLFVALYVFAIIQGKYTGAAAGFIVGFLQDAMTVGIFGFHILTRTVFGYLIGGITKNINEDYMRYHLGMMFSCSLALRCCYGVIEFINTGCYLNMLPYFLWQTLGYALGNAILVLPMFFAFKLVHLWVCKGEITY